MGGKGKRREEERILHTEKKSAPMSEYPVAFIAILYSLYF